MQRQAIEHALAARGRGGDTMIAHLNPVEALMLRRLGGSGTINPRTGLREFTADPRGDIGGGENHGNQPGGDHGMGGNVGNGGGGNPGGGGGHAGDGHSSEGSGGGAGAVIPARVEASTIRTSPPFNSRLLSSSSRSL